MYFQLFLQKNEGIRVYCIKKSGNICMNEKYLLKLKNNVQKPDEEITRMLLKTNCHEKDCSFYCIDFVCCDHNDVRMLRLRSSFSAMAP